MFKDRFDKASLDALTVRLKRQEESWNPNRKATDQGHLRGHDGIGKG